MKTTFFFTFFHILLFSFAQQRIQIVEKATDFPISDVEIRNLSDKLIATSDADGVILLDNSIQEIYIDHPGFPPQIFKLPVPDNVILLEQDMVSLRDLVIKPNDSKALDLVRMVIEHQSENSPKALGNFKIKSYTKFWADAESDSIQFIPNPKTKEDSAQNKSKQLLANSMFFLSERAISHYYDNKKGEKNIVEAAKISGVQTPLYEFVALQPISVAFEQKEFNFFFRKFPNPLSRAGMKSYNYFISDTILRNNRRQIELNFSSKSDEKKSLHGMALIDANSFALTRFYAENQTQRGSDTYIEVVYQPVQNVWIPDYQIFKIEGNNVSSHSYQDSIAPNGETVQKKIIKKSKSWMNANTDFFDFESPATIDNQIFKGLKNEVPKSAFTDFDNKIKDFRGDDLIQRETTTYVTIDSIGKAEKVDRYIKIYRIISQEGWLSLGKLDLDLKELYTGNQYEDWRFGLSARTNHKLHPKLSANARAYYGTRDNVFKYGVGASYLVAPEKHARFFVDYSDDILAAGRFENPITTLFENLAWKSEQAANPFFVDENRISIGYEQDFFRKFTGRITLSKTPQKALFDYSFADFAPDYEYNLTQAQLAIRYAPREEAVITPMGKMRIIRDLPVYKLLIDQGLNFLNGEQEFTRIDFNANFSWNIFSKPTLFNLRGGKVFGQVPLWNYFDGGGKSRDAEGFWQRMRFGGTQIFETMIPGEFITDQYIFASAKQQFFNLKLGKKFQIPIVGVYKIGLGKFEHEELHHNLEFKNMNSPFQEVGLELNNLIFRVLGVGLYYRIGAYQFNQFDRDLSVKAVLNLSNF